MALHVYGVTRADVPVPSDLRGRGDGLLRTVTHAGLAVVVSDVERDAPAGRRDLLAHARVLEHYAEDVTVLPMQFGVVVPDEERVREQVLAADGDSLQHLLRSFDGLVQVTVQAFHHEEPALREVLHRDPQLLAAKEQLRGGSTALKVELGQMVAAALQDLQEDDRIVLLDALAPLSRAVAENDARGQHEVMHAAFLVERSARPGFDEAVGALRARYEDRLRLRYVGPQPPYSFLEPVQTGELAWD